MSFLSDIPNMHAKNKLSRFFDMKIEMTEFVNYFGRDWQQYFVNEVGPPSVVNLWYCRRLTPAVTDLWLFVHVVTC